MKVERRKHAFFRTRVAQIDQFPASLLFNDRRLQREMSGLALQSRKASVEGAIPKRAVAIENDDLMRLSFERVDAAGDHGCQRREEAVGVRSRDPSIRGLVVI